MKIVYGPKGTGKTKIVIDEANALIESAKGHVVFITDTNRYMYDLKNQIRFINLSEYEVATEESLAGFVKGIVAANYDNEYIYVDGIARITNKPLCELESFFTLVETLEKNSSANFVFTCSADKAELPEFLKKYAE